MATSGKDRAIFGLLQLTRFSFRYYVILISVCALIFALAGTNQPRNIKAIAITLSIFSIILIFPDVWKIFV
jgi:hypothetical protein